MYTVHVLKLIGPSEHPAAVVLKTACLQGKGELTSAPYDFLPWISSICYVIIMEFCYHALQTAFSVDSSGAVKRICWCSGAQIRTWHLPSAKSATWVSLGPQRVLGSLCHTLSSRDRPRVRFDGSSERKAAGRIVRKTMKAILPLVPY